MNVMLDYLARESAFLLNFWLTLQLQTAAFILLIWLVERALPLPAFFLAPVEATAAATSALPATEFPVQAVILFAVVASSFLLAAVAVWRAIDLRRLLHAARPFEWTNTGIAAEDWPPVFVSDRIPSPLATGIRHPRIYITPSIAAAPREILLAVLQHERAHIRRRDGIMVVAQTLVQILYVLNPLVWMANLRIFRYRELICDEEAMAAAGTRPQDYGRLLVDFAEAQPARILQTGTCFFETRRGFVQRVSELFNAGHRESLRWKHYAAVVLTALLILPLSWHCEQRTVTYTETLTEYPENALGAEAKTAGPSTAVDYPVKSQMEYVKQGELENMAGPRIDGGLDALRARIEYPEQAMREGIEGVVVIEATVEKDGPATSLRVIKSVHPDLDEAALAAVQGVRFKAGHRNEKVIESTISIPIKFKLQ